MLFYFAQVFNLDVVSEYGRTFLKLDILKILDVELGVESGALNTRNQIFGRHKAVGRQKLKYLSLVFGVFTSEFFDVIVHLITLL